LIPDLNSAKGTQSSGGKKKKEEEENRLNSKSWAKNHWCRDDCHEDDWDCCDYECKPKCKITNDVCETDEDFTLTTTSTPPVTSHLTSLAILLPQEYRIVVDGQAGCSFDVNNTFYWFAISLDRWYSYDLLICHQPIEWLLFCMEN
jgi:hypothetical protein